MVNCANVITGCQIVGEFVDEAELPPNLISHRGDVVRPKVQANYIDLWSKDNACRDFTVLLKDGCTVVVRGQGLKHFPAIGNELSGSYGIFVLNGDEEVIVALFKAIEVIGIFHGEMRLNRKIA